MYLFDKMGLVERVMLGSAESNMLTFEPNTISRCLTLFANSKQFFAFGLCAFSGAGEEGQYGGFAIMKLNNSRI